MSTLASGQSTQATQATAARGTSSFKKIWKHWHWFAGLLIVVVLLFFWRGCTERNVQTPQGTVATQQQTPAQDAPAGTASAGSAGSEMAYLTLSGGECSEAVGVPRGQNIDWWFLQGTIKVDGRKTPSAEWSGTMDGPMSHYRFCGSGKVGYRIRPS